MDNLDKVYAENIAKEYMPKETNKLRQLKKLDEKAKRPAFIAAMTIGIIGALVFGTGMSFGLGAIGSGTSAMVLAAVLGILGFIMCVANYPLYKRLLEKGKQKYAFEIIELAKEISKENT